MSLIHDAPIASLGSDPSAEQRVRAGEFQAQYRMREPNNGVAPLQGPMADAEAEHKRASTGYGAPKCP